MFNKWAKKKTNKMIMNLPGKDERNNKRQCWIENYDIKYNINFWRKQAIRKETIIDLTIIIILWVEKRLVFLKEVIGYKAKSF